MPVFPPTELSTWESKVVGTCMHFTPLSTIELAKPTKSPVTPPPIEIIIESLLILWDKIKSIKYDSSSKFLNLSFDLILKKKVCDDNLEESLSNFSNKFLCDFNLLKNSS